MAQQGGCPAGIRVNVWRSAARALIYRAPDERDRCPACGSRRLSDLDLLALRYPYRRRIGFVDVCDECGVVFSNPLPSMESLARFYSPDGPWRPAGLGPSGLVGSEATHGRSWTRPFDAIRDELDVSAPAPGQRVLDYGCGTGKLLDAMQARGWETWGLEPAIDQAFTRHGRLTAIPGEPAFDLIVLNHVLEHVTAPFDLLRQLAGACRPGGFLFISVPRLDTLPVHRDYKYVINGRAHVMAYTWPCLQGLLARSGWGVAAPPPDRVAKGRGRMTFSRLRVIARLGATRANLPSAPAQAARAAIHQYHGGIPGRPWLERLGLYRLAARRSEARRQRDARGRRLAKAAAEIVR